MGGRTGLFQGVRIRVERESDTAANSIALLAQNQLQMVEGGISAAYFNALEKNLPVNMVLDRVQSARHNLAAAGSLRRDHRLRQLRGRTIATNGHGRFRKPKAPETDGLTLNDVEIKVLLFTHIRSPCQQGCDRRCHCDPAVPPRN